MCTMRHIAISGSFNASEWSDWVGMSWVDCWMTWFHILEGEIGGGKKVRMKNHLFGNRTAPHLLLKHAKARKTHEKHQLPTTSFYDKTLFEPALPPLAGGLPCHLPAVGTGRKHNPEDCRSLGWNMTNPDDLGCALASLWPFAAARRSNAVCFSFDKNCGNGEGASCEPCWTLPLRNTLFTHAGNDLVQTAPASASAAPMSSDSRGGRNCSTCRKKEFARRVWRYCI